LTALLLLLWLLLLLLSQACLLELWLCLPACAAPFYYSTALLLLLWLLSLLLLLPQSQACLLELWLGRNRISKIENLSHMTALRRISLQSNRCAAAAAAALP
jgi:hypothetical protein